MNALSPKAIQFYGGRFWTNTWIQSTMRSEWIIVIICIDKAQWLTLNMTVVQWHDREHTQHEHELWSWMLDLKCNVIMSWNRSTFLFYTDSGVLYSEGHIHVHVHELKLTMRHIHILVHNRTGIYTNFSLSLSPSLPISLSSSLNPHTFSSHSFYNSCVIHSYFLINFHPLTQNTKPK